MAGKFDTIGYPEASLGSMARAGPNTPAWWSDTNASWNPETGLDIYGNYGGPIGTSGPMDAGGGDRGDAANIANGWTQPAPKQTTMQPTPFPSQDRWLPDGSGVLGMQQSPPTQPPISGMNFNPTTNSYNPFAIGAGGVGAGATGAGLFGAGLFGGQLQNYMMPPSMNTASLYDSMMGFRGGLFGQQLQPNAMMQYRMGYPGSNANLGYPMQLPNISQPMQQQFNQQQPAFFDSLAYRPL